MGDRRVALTPLLALAVTLVTSACTATVAGFTSPLAHDYGSVQWLPLTGVVEQAFVTGPGYADAIADDATTTPAELQQRQAALPEDARTGELSELRVGLRLAAEGAEARGIWDTGTRVQLVPLPGADLRFPEGRRGFHEWPESDHWLPATDEYTQSFVSPYDNLTGITVRVATFGADLTPGEATVGPKGAEAQTLPADGEPISMLEAGQRLRVIGAAEGWAQVQFPDGLTGFVPLESFSELPEPERRTGDVIFTLRDPSGAIIRETIIPASAIHDNAHLNVTFDPLPASGGQPFTFEFAPEDPSLGAFTLRATGGDEYDAGTRQGVEGTDDLVFRPEYAESPPLLDLPIDALQRDGDWVVIDNPPDVPSGITVGLRLVPGDRDDSGKVQYGVTSERAPYGAVRATDASGATLPGALALATTWERDVDVGSIVSDGLDNLRAAAADDPLLAAIYATLLFSMAAISLKLWHVLFPRRGD